MRYPKIPPVDAEEAYLKNLQGVCLMYAKKGILNPEHLKSQELLQKRRVQRAEYPQVYEELQRRFPVCAADENQVKRFMELLLRELYANPQNRAQVTAKGEILEAIQKHHDEISLEIQQAVLRYEVDYAANQNCYDSLMSSMNESLRVLKSKSNHSNACMEAHFCKGWIQHFEHVGEEDHDKALRIVVCVVKRENDRLTPQMRAYENPSEYLYSSMLLRAQNFISQNELLRIDAFLRRTQPDFGDQWPILLARLHSELPEFSGDMLDRAIDKVFE